ncbi:XRE family transcriptional regulator [Agrobacterium rubi]|uniref:XRE family transcriptional regulator n=1 Tax=Agrobacterium rubi TaxID=28099 RepID=UPI001574CDDE|nr:XRE family transcriptional regulator [Agrobacterium rubi]NTE87237.1 helix-turn-helix domain-containing protein [Agrobacterium rubi]NTF03171.1 helix-turn-helix domain-containing protein [Agrobacterium rubi]
MGNKLKSLREERGWTHEKAAEEMGVSRSQFIKLERGERRMTIDYINRAAKAFGLRPSDIVDDMNDNTVPLVGYIGAGSEIMPEFEQIPPEGLEQISVPFPLPDEMIALEVRGESMLPVYKDGHVLIVYAEQKRPLQAFYGEEAAVRTSDGRRFLKTIMKGSPITLMSFNAAPIENISLEWIGEIFATIPRLQVKRVEKMGGIQGALI